MSTETEDTARERTAGRSEREQTGRGGANALADVARYEARNRVPVTVVLSVLFSLFGTFYVWLGPEVVAGEQMQDLLDSLPPALSELFGFESLESLGGLLASEFYTFGWIVGLGGYVAYSAAGTVAGDLRDERMDLLLAGPVARRSVLLGKYLALLVPILVVNVVVPVALYLGSVAVGDPLSAADLAVLHALSVPYLLLWSAVGLLLGVVVRGGRTAGRLALGLVFAGWIVGAVLSTTDYAWVGAVSPTRYFDPPAVLVDGSYDLAGAALLLVAAAALVGLSLVWFERSDL